MNFFTTVYLLVNCWLSVLLSFSGEGLLDCFRTVAVPAANGEDSSAGALKDVEDGHTGSPAGSPELARDDSTGGLEEVALEEVALDDVTSPEGGRPLPGNIVRIPSYKLSPSKHAHVTAVEKLVFESVCSCVFPCVFI